MNIHISAKVTRGTCNFTMDRSGCHHLKLIINISITNGEAGRDYASPYMVK